MPDNTKRPGDVPRLVGRQYPGFIWGVVAALSAVAIFILGMIFG